MLIRKALLFLLIAALQFAVFEVALRTWGHSEAAPSFETLFVPDPTIGYRLRPGAHTRFVTDEFDTTIAVNSQGVRDDSDIGPKPRGERRIVVLGDSIVLSVQVDGQQTFAHLLEERLNARGGPVRYRVINAGVQGYGPVEELLFYRRIARAFQPDLVIETIFVGNDAEEAYASQGRLRAPEGPTAGAAADSLTSRLRRVVRRSLVLQVLRLRVVSVTDRLTNWMSPPEAPLQSYAATPPARVVDGLRVSADCVRQIADDASHDGARTMVMLVPARFQVDDPDYGRLKDIVSGAGGSLVRDAATTRFADAIRPLGLPIFDALPALRGSLPGPDVFFQQTVHLTPRGHVIVADALERFLRQQGLL
jgi:lysophospholipase L1-like esterase